MLAYTSTPRYLSMGLGLYGGGVYSPQRTCRSGTSHKERLHLRYRASVPAGAGVAAGATFRCRCRSGAGAAPVAASAPSTVVVAAHLRSAGSWSRSPVSGVDGLERSVGQVQETRYSDPRAMCGLIECVGSTWR